MEEVRQRVGESDEDFTDDVHNHQSSQGLPPPVDSFGVVFVRPYLRSLWMKLFNDNAGDSQTLRTADKCGFQFFSPTVNIR